MVTNCHRRLSIAAAMLMMVQFGVAQYRFHHYGVKDGLANDFNWNIEQDSLGFIWVFYNLGMSRFDGYNFKIYKYDPDDSLRSKLNFSMEWPAKDHNKNLWFTQHMNVGPKHILARHDNRTDGFIKYEIDLGGEWPKGAWAIYNSREFEKDGSLVWIGTDGKGLFNYNFETGETKNYLNLDPDGKPRRPLSIGGIKDLGHSLLLATGFGLWIFDKTTKSYSRPACRPADTILLYQNPVWEIIRSPHLKENSIWLKLKNGIVKIDSTFSVVQKYEFPEGVTMSHCSRDREGVFWFAGSYNSNTGLFRFDPRDSSLINLKHDPGDPRSLASNYVLGVMVDNDQNVWVGGDRGVSVLRRQDLKFYNTKVDDGILCANTIYKTASGQEYLILGKRKLASSYNQLYIAPIFPKRLDSINLKPILEPMEGIEIQGVHKGKHLFWVSSIGSGVIGYPIDPKTGMIVPKAEVRLRHDPQNANSIRSDAVHYVWEDPDENLWVGNVNGPPNKVRRDIPYGREGSVMQYGSEFNWEGPFYTNDESSFWMLRSNEGIYKYHIRAANGTDPFEQVVKTKYGSTTMSVASDGVLLIGTPRGLYTATTDGIKYKISESPLISDTEVDAVLEDQLGRWWTYGANKIICFDRRDSATTVFDIDDGLDHIRATYRDWFLKTSDGIFVVVSPEGISLFDPAKLQKNNRKIAPVLTHLKVNNNTVIGRTIPFDPDFSLPSDISVLRELVLDYQHNNFTVEFSAMQMTAPEKNLYQHKLEGYDKDWIKTDSRNRTATYTNLDPGNYTFKVKASNHQGVWSDLEKTLFVRILPPPWKTWWAYTGYGLLIVGLLFLARRTIVQRERLKSNLKLAKVEQEKEHFELEKAKEVDKVKSTFFANISHEFRTPLTLIKGPVQEMLEDFADHPKVKERMKLVQRNSDLVLKLINQLLDLAKLESGTLSIEKSENDLNVFLSVVMNSFSSLAFQKNIKLEEELPSVRYLVRFDKDKLDTILINLINNAIKFTPSGGAVTIRTEVESLQYHPETYSSGTPLGVGGMVTITVSDTGIGIPLDQQTKVFERFHQVSEAHKEVGTGIGLSLVKELVALMNGTLSLKSEPRLGSIFTVTLPVEVIHVFSETEVVVDFKEQLVSEEFTLKENGNGQEPHGDNKPRILVVEDNGDLRKFIIDCVGKEFHFLEASDGKQGMEKAFEETPDLIISDVMMPEMDGITMTGKLKKDTRTSHIPLILLTAKTSDESKLSGLGTGADDYLTKPFNKNELLLKVRNSIAARAKLREKIKLELLKESPKVEVKSEEEQFLYRVRETILKRLSDEQLSVESLAEEIGLSRSQLLRKITALTGTSVNELIRTFRLQKAAQLLEQNWGPVTQIAYEVGFSNLSYFSKVFKEQYGVLPSEYITKV